VTLQARSVESAAAADGEARARRAAEELRAERTRSSDRESTAMRLLEEAQRALSTAGVAAAAAAEEGIAAAREEGRVALYAAREEGRTALFQLEDQLRIQVCC